jgi:FtsP/CotA-like multicopper oxidase with cupredoxin domain
MKAYRLVPVVAILTAACGGGDAPPADSGAPAAEPAPATPAGPSVPGGAVSVPEWYVVDHDARTVSLSITAGSTPDNNYWNFNGYTKGAISVVVPEGYTVTVELVNADPNMAHSLGISAELSNFAVPPAPTPVFAGAITENPQSMVDATMPGETETITFVADAAGTYSMVCYIPGHTAIGMWVFFEVSADGDAGVRGI